MAWHPTWNEQPDRRGRYRHERLGWQMRGRSMVTQLLIVNVVVFVVLQYLGQLFRIGDVTLAYLVEEYGTSRASDIIPGLQLWRLLTFQFLHGDLGHIFWNMFGLWMFGRWVEFQLGPRKFLWIYLVSGIVGGLTECGFDYLMHSQGYVIHLVSGDLAFIDIPSLGASGGVCGIMIAFAVLNPEAKILLMLILPVRAKWLAVGYAAFQTLPLLRMISEGPSGVGVAYAAHLGGMACAFVWLMLDGYIRHPVARRISSAFERLRGAGRRRTSPGEPRRPHPVVPGPNTGRTVSESRDRSAPPDRGRTAADEARLDAILRKIHDVGLAGLTNEERKFLRDMSRRTRSDADFDDRYRRE